LGWAIGRNVRIDTRWAGASAAEIRRHAAVLVALAPDVILAHGVPDLGTVAASDPHRADRTAADPVPPEPCAPPCIRHLLFPATEGDRHGVPARVLAPHRAALRKA
jgi:hypothetical protein